MTRNVKVFLSLLFIFCMLSVFATVALAEPEESTVSDESLTTEESSVEQTSSGTPSADDVTSDEPTPSDDPASSDEPTPSDDPASSDEPTPSDDPASSDEPTPSDDPTSSDEPTPSDDPTSSEDTSSEDTSSEDPASQTRKVRAAGDLGSVLVYFTGATSPMTEFDAPIGQELTFRVVAQDGYQVDSVELWNVPLFPDEEGYYSLEIMAEVSTYVINITASVADEPNPSDDPSGDTSSGDTSSEDSSEEPDNTAELTVSIKGAGSVSFGTENFSNAGSSTNAKTFRVEMGNLTLSIAPAYGYKLSSLRVNGETRVLVETLSLVFDENTSVDVVFVPDTVEPTTYQILVSCATAGGYISAGDDPITSGNAKTISVAAGGKLVITVYPAEGYEVDAFRVGGVAQNLVDGKYTLENIAANTNVTVSFKAVTTQIVPAEATDYDWKADENGLIVIDLGSNTYIGKSIFDKINTLTVADGKYVALQTTYIKWFIPCGGQVGDVDGDYMHISVALGANGSYYNTIEGAIHQSNPDTIFQYYELSETPTFPEGTLASFHLADLAATYGGNGVDLLIKEGSSLVLKGEGSSGTDGWTSRMVYGTSRYLVVRVNIAPEYTITVSSGVNGTISPAGSNSVTLGSSASFTVEASAGYMISVVYVDGVAIAGAPTQSTFVYTFDNVTTNHTVTAEFIASNTEGRVVDNKFVPAEPTVSEEPDGTSYTGLIVALIIIFVAIAGAAVLFVVKWRQEKF